MGQIHGLNIHSSVKGAQSSCRSRSGRRCWLVDSPVSLTASRYFPTEQNLISDDHVDAVILASPDVTHGPYVLSSIDAGKPLLCEKPIAGTVAEALDIVRCEAELGQRRLVQVGFMREFDRSHQRVRSIMQSGNIGEVVMFRGLHVLRDTGGDSISAKTVVLSTLIHDIHSVRFLTGREICSVYVRTRVDVRGGVTVLSANMALDNGAIALLDVNLAAHYGYAVHAEVLGTARHCQHDSTSHRHGSTGCRD